MENAVQLLRDDHYRVKCLFKEFEDADQKEKYRIVQTALSELEVHTQVEEEIFYPAVRGKLNEDDLMDEADEEHKAAERLMAELKGMKPGADHYDAKFTVLAEEIKHHIEEEESEMFPMVERSGLDLFELGERMSQRKDELMAGATAGNKGNGARRAKPRARAGR
jgi:hemerythrin-like domain-containing protein